MLKEAAPVAEPAAEEEPPTDLQARPLASVEQAAKEEPSGGSGTYTGSVAAVVIAASK